MRGDGAAGLKKRFPSSKKQFPSSKGCPALKMPSTRREFWREKIGKNKERDARNEAALRELGWNVVIIWECELANLEKCDELAKMLRYLIERRPMEHSLGQGVNK